MGKWQVHRTANICRTTVMRGSEVHRTAILKRHDNHCFGALHLNQHFLLDDYKDSGALHLAPSLNRIYKDRHD